MEKNIQRSSTFPIKILRRAIDTHKVWRSYYDELHFIIIFNALICVHLSVWPCAGARTYVCLMWIFYYMNEIISRFFDLSLSLSLCFVFIFFCLLIFFIFGERNNKMISRFIATIKGSTYNMQPSI